LAKILITYPLASSRIEELRRKHEVVILPRGAEVTETVLCREAADCDALAVLLLHRVTERVLEAAPRLRIVANVAVGYDNIAVEAARRRGVYVSNTPDVLTRATGDLTWALILACARRIVEADRFLRDGRFSGWGPELFVGMDLHGKRLGVVGLGRIGREVAGRAGAFGMSVLFADEAAPRPDFPARRCSLEETVREADVLTLHVPLTSETRRLLSRERLFQMKPGAVLINTSRGPVVDEAALVEALKLGRLRAAGLDVYENEPAVHPGLLALPQAVLLPHIGSAGEDTRRRMADLALDNIARVLEGGRPLTNIWPLD